MKKNYFYLALAMTLLTGKGYAQEPCATSDVHNEFLKKSESVGIFERMLNESTASYIASHSEHAMTSAKTTAAHSDTDYYDIPVVVHIIHNYGSELVSDSIVHVMIDQMNAFYNAQNNLSTIIPPFVPYIGNAKIRFHLATKDPMGQQTTGITHKFSYLTYGGDDQAKVGQWPPRSYMNIWVENVIGRGIGVGTVLAYAVLPPSAEAFPYSDGVISIASRLTDNNTIPHETGHYFNLYHPWNSGAGVGEVCGDDEVDDTPPTKGHFSLCRNPQELYDTTCAFNYFKMYTSASGSVDSLVNYPDTTNTQNLMDYSQCSQSMITKGQVWRMRGALNSNIGGRNNLWDSANLVLTGALDPYPDMVPVPDFVSRQGTSPISEISRFTYPNSYLFFTNKSWRDTVTSVKWTFSNGAEDPTPVHTSVIDLRTRFSNRFSEPGWVDIKMEVEGNNSGTGTKEFKKIVFVADNEGRDPAGYLQEFNEDGDRDKWPTFNFYENSNKWQLANTGVYDGTSMMYQGFDTRTGLELLTNTPIGDYDDMYSIPFDLTSFGSGECNLNFFFAGASKTASSDNINDSLTIEYAVNKSQSWKTLKVMKKGELCNNGATSEAFVPTSPSNWSPMTISIPTAARTDYVVFRFRYKPGGIPAGSNPVTISSGNNFYIDRLNISQWTADVSTVDMTNADVKVVPNPTHGDAYVVIKASGSTTADIVVSDITGKIVYTTTENLSSNTSRVKIPHDVIATQGIYLIQTTTGKQVSTNKLVVY